MDRLLAQFHRPPITWWDVLDIVIVSILIYEALKLIRGTRAVQMAIGSVLVLILFSFSNLFPLQTVNWLIRNIIGYVVFAAIVLLQADIRRALVHLGRGKLFRRLDILDTRPFDCVAGGEGMARQETILWRPRTLQRMDLEDKAALMDELADILLSPGLDYRGVRLTLRQGAKTLAVAAMHRAKTRTPSAPLICQTVSAGPCRTRSAWMKFAN